MSQLPFLQHARSLMAEAVERLESKLEASKSTLVGEPYILVDSACHFRAFMRNAAGQPMIGPAPDLLIGVFHYSPKDAKRVAAEVTGKSGTQLVPMFARDWQQDRLKENRHSLAELDKLIAEQSAAPAAE